MTREADQTVRLSVKDMWVVFGFLVLHGAAIVASAWTYTQGLESRLTKLEVNQQVIYRSVERLEGHRLQRIEDDR
jgi:hypothetical protein